MASARYLTLWGSAASLVMLASCGLATPDPAFESVFTSAVECPAGAGEGLACVLVEAEVVGTETGTGSCEIYSALVDLILRRLPRNHPTSR